MESTQMASSDGVAHGLGIGMASASREAEAARRAAPERSSSATADGIAAKADWRHVAAVTKARRRALGPLFAKGGADLELA